MLASPSTRYPNAILVPTEAIQTSQEGQFVFVVGNDMKAQPHPVVAGPAIGDETVIERGVAAGATVVTDGQLRLMPGATVRIKDSLDEAVRLMNLAETFIRRPVMTSLISIAIVIFGLFRLSPVAGERLPNVDFPTIVVYASLPGASPETMASSVATPLEKEFSTIAGLIEMTSASTQGSTNITLAIRPESQSRRRRSGRAVENRGGARAIAPRHAQSAVLSKGQSRRSGDPLSGPELALAAAVAG